MKNREFESEIKAISLIKLLYELGKVSSGIAGKTLKLAGET
jgi:hypothetical protein